MKLQEKIEELIRESDLVSEATIDEELSGVSEINNDNAVANGFISGFEYACKCVLILLKDFKINPELDKRG